jgi:hypothetical protein
MIIQDTYINENFVCAIVPHTEIPNTYIVHFIDSSMHILLTMSAEDYMDVLTFINGANNPALNADDINEEYDLEGDLHGTIG